MNAGTHTKAKCTVSINNVPVRLLFAQLMLFILCLSIPFLVTIWRGLNFKEHGIEAVAIANSISVYKSHSGSKSFRYSTQCYEFSDTFHSFSTGASGYTRLPHGSAVPIVYLPYNRNSAILGTKEDSPLELGHMSTIFEWNARILLGLLFYFFTAYGAYYYAVHAPEGLPKLDFFTCGFAVSLSFLKRMHFGEIILLTYFISSVVYFVGVAANKHQPQLLSKSCGEGSFSAYHMPNDSVTIVLDSHIWDIIRSDQFDMRKFPIGTVHWDHRLNGISIYCMVNRVGNHSMVSIYNSKRTWYAIKDSILDSCFYYFDNKVFPSCKLAENQSGIIISAGDTTCTHQFNSDSLLNELKPEKEPVKANVSETPLGMQQYPEDTIIKSIRNLMGYVDSLRGSCLKKIDSGQ